MNLTELIKTDSIEENVTYTLNGHKEVIHPRADCTVSSEADEITQLKEISGKFYCYGQIKAEIISGKTKAKNRLSYLKSEMSLEQEKLLLIANPKARVTDKRLDSLVTVEPSVVAAKDKLAEFEKYEIKIDIILKALLLKEEELLEASRRNKKEMELLGNKINNLG